jgi:hypothetical protein
VYIKRGQGRGWPEECPPIRAANRFGFDVLANFDLTFVRRDRLGSKWTIGKDIVIESDFGYAASNASEGAPLVQQYAWFWEKGQKLPHVITDNVYKNIANQVKVSSYLFLKTDPGEMLLVTEVPNLRRPWRAMSALIETDWYPASYPWHVVLELNRNARRIVIRKGEALARLIPVRRGEYTARAMSQRAFSKFFDRGQAWLEAHGKFEHEAADEGVADITGTYRKQQKRAKFIVMK